MVYDAHKNLAYSTVATAPSPATSGTSLVVQSGQGSRFPDPGTDGAFNVVIWPVGSVANPSNAEIVRVTARTSDTLTITRTQESTSARTIVVGDQIALAPTAKLFTDIEAAIPVGAFTSIDRQVFTSNGTWTKPAGAKYVFVQVQGGGGAGGGATSSATASACSVGGGGGGGGYVEKLFAASDLGASVSVTVGAGGTAASGATGGTGGNSVFSAGTVLTGAGGAGGSVRASTTGNGHANGGNNLPSSGSGAQLFEGSDGYAGLSLPPLAIGGAGGDAALGRGQKGGATSTTNQALLGDGGNNYGGGGGGSAINGNTGSNSSGGAGGPGIVIVTTYVG